MNDEERRNSRPKDTYERRQLEDGNVFHILFGADDEAFVVLCRPCRRMTSQLGTRQEQSDKCHMCGEPLVYFWGRSCTGFLERKK